LLGELRAHPESRAVLAHCCTCGIEFATSARNSGRTYLRCPFGCREAHKKAQSKKRASDYGKTKEGKFKKSLLNRKAYVRKKSAQQAADRQHSEADLSPAKGLDELLKPIPAPPRFSGTFLEYLAQLLRCLYGAEISTTQIHRYLLEKFRQRSFALLGRSDYMVRNSREGPTP